MSPADKQQRLDQFFAAHREGGLPVTIQRRAVFEAILERQDHPTAEQVYRAVRQDLPQISRMTVHRILGTFVSLGLVAKTCHPGSAARFDPKIHQHHHLVCLDCGAIIDVEDPRLNRHTVAPGQSPRVHHPGLPCSLPGPLCPLPAKAPRAPAQAEGPTPIGGIQDDFEINT